MTPFLSKLTLACAAAGFVAGLSLNSLTARRETQAASAKPPRLPAPSKTATAPLQQRDEDRLIEERRELTAQLQAAERRLSELRLAKARSPESAPSKTELSPEKPDFAAEFSQRWQALEADLGSGLSLSSPPQAQEKAEKAYLEFVGFCHRDRRASIALLLRRLEDREDATKFDVDFALNTLRMLAPNARENARLTRALVRQLGVQEHPDLQETLPGQIRLNTRSPDRGVVDALAEVARHGKVPAGRLNAAQLLASLSPLPARRRAFDFVCDPQASTPAREAALKLLNLKGLPNVEDRLIGLSALEALRSTAFERLASLPPSPQARRAAEDAIVHHQNASALPGILKALANHADNNSVEPLRRIAADPGYSPAQREAAQDALRQLRDRLGPVVKR